MLYVRMAQFKIGSECDTQRTVHRDIFV